MTKRFLSSGLRTAIIALSAIFFTSQAAFAQPPMGPPSAGGEGEMPWQVAALFTANWVLVAVAVAMMSRYSKRSEKPKKAAFEEAA